MKKIIFAVFAMFFMGSAQALDLNVSAHNSNHSSAFTGLAVGHKWGKVGGQVGLDMNRAGADWNRFSVTGSYDVMKLGSATVDVRAGVAHIDNQVGRNGYSMLVGVGVSVPVTKQVSWTAGWTVQNAQTRIGQHDGNEVRTGLKFAF